MHAKVKNIQIDVIPVIDVAPMFEGEKGEREVGTKLLNTVQEVGFFYIKNHSVQQSLIDEVFAQGKRFFRATTEQKNEVMIKDFHRGFLPIGEAKMSGAQCEDYKESFVWGWEVAKDDIEVRNSNGMLAPNRWPSFQPKMEKIFSSYLNEVNTLGVHLLGALALGLGVNREHFIRCFSKPLTRAAVVYYPPQSSEKDNQQYGVSPHTDYGCITLLYQDEVGGLQVRHRNGEWVTAHPLPGTYVVNIGDLLHRWSNKRFISNPHRVINISGKERFSVPVFVDPDWNTLIEPLRNSNEQQHYPPVRCADYIHSIYKKSFAYRS